MATTKPRITVTLTERQHDVLRSISSNSGQSMSAFVSDLLEQTLPVLERMAETFRKIKSAQDEQKKRIVFELDEAQTAVEPILGQVLGQFDLFMSRMELAAGADAAADGKQRAAAAASEDASLTPVTNRGVTPPPDISPKPLRHKALRRSDVSKVSSKKTA